MNGDVGVFPRQSRVPLRRHETALAVYPPPNGRRAVAPPTHLIGEELQNQVTLALDFRRARPRLQLKPGVVADDGHFLQRQNPLGWPARTPAGSAVLGALTLKGMLMQPRKSSAFSSEPEDADPLARTDLAICLKYLGTRSTGAASQTDQVYQDRASLRNRNGDSSLAVLYLPIPRSPLTSLSFLQASATDTSSSWSLNRITKA